MTAVDSGDSGSTGASGATGLSGSITVSGSSTVLPISNLVAELFAGQNPDVQVSVDGPGTGDGFVLFCKGETDISDASRPIEDDETAACTDGRHRLRRARDRVRRHHGHDEPAEQRRHVPELRRPLLAVRPRVRGIDTWNGADSLAKKVGGKDDFPDAPLEITAPGDESGTYDAFIELSGITDIAIAQGLTEDKAATLRPDYQSSPDDNVIIQAMEGSARALGFVGFAYAEEAADQVKEHPGRRGERLRRADPRHDRRRLLPAVAHALHLRQQGEDREQPGAEGVRGPVPVR